MAKKTFDIREEIIQAKLDAELLQKANCSKEENKAYFEMLQNGQDLPSGVYQHVNLDGTGTGEFFVVHDPQLTYQERQEYLALMQYQNIQTIRKCVVFFTILSVITLVVGALFFIGLT